MAVGDLGSQTHVDTAARCVGGVYLGLVVALVAQEPLEVGSEIVAGWNCFLGSVVVLTLQQDRKSTRLNSSHG